MIVEMVKEAMDKNSKTKMKKISDMALYEDIGMKYLNDVLRIEEK